MKKRRRIMQKNQHKNGFNDGVKSDSRLVSFFKTYAAKYGEPGGIKSARSPGKKEA